MNGESVEEAADATEVTISTARTHVRHLIEKTGSQRLPDLIRVLMLSAAGLREPESHASGMA